MTKANVGPVFPSVLSFQRGTIVSDGIMSSIVKGRDGKLSSKPVRVIRHGIRGVLPDKSKDSVSNPQRTESAKTSPDAQGLEVRFSFRTISARDLIFACSESLFRTCLDQFQERYFRPGVPEFEEVCRRYARNILNGRWLWRNRVLGRVSVQATSAGKTYSGDGSRLNDFDDFTADELALAADVIVPGFLWQGMPVVDVVGRVDFGFTGEVEVFPSQNMVTQKPRGFARSLYKINMPSRHDLDAIMSTAKGGADEFMADMIEMGDAAIRDQKIGNAIRTIDTWYPAVEGGAAAGVHPISIEPTGASLADNKLYRSPSSRKDALTLLKSLAALAYSDASEEASGQGFNVDAAFLIALFVRGGVFSEGKDKGDDVKKPTKRGKKAEQGPGSPDTETEEASGESDD